MAARAYERDGGLSGLSSGLTDLDRMMGGLQNSDLIILAGRPSMGKTALATNIAFNIARAFRTAPKGDGTEQAVDGAVVGFFSLEMSSEQLATRILAEQSQIPSEKIRRGQITDAEFNRLQSAAMELQTLPLFIDHTGGISIAQLARARKASQAAEGPRPYCRRLFAAFDGIGEALAGRPRTGSVGNYRRAQGAGEGVVCADPRAVAALAPGREPRRQAPAAVGLARSRAPSSRMPTS